MGILIFQGKEQEGAWNKWLELSDHRAIHNKLYHSVHWRHWNSETFSDISKDTQVHSSWFWEPASYNKAFLPKATSCLNSGWKYSRCIYQVQFLLDSEWQTQPNISFSVKILQHFIEYGFMYTV